MTVRLLDPAEAAELRRQPFTYAEVGATRAVLPAGYHHVTRVRTLPADVDFDRVGDDLLGWRMHARAGLRVCASTRRAEPDTVVVLRIGVGPVGVTAPCRVAYLLDEPHRRGFAYGTLPGHPEIGEEAFVVERLADGTCRFAITAFSRPGRRLTRVAGPAGTWVQHLMTNHYLRRVAD